MLVSSHLLAEVAQTADRVVVIDHGRLTSSGPASQLTTATGQAVVVRAPRGPTRSQVTMPAARRAAADTGLSADAQAISQ